MADGTWTFDDSIKPEVAEALASLFSDEDFTPGGFITGGLVGVMGYGTDSDPCYRFRFVGSSRLLESIGLAEVMKMWIAREFAGGPIPNVSDTEDDDDD